MGELTAEKIDKYEKLKKELVNELELIASDIAWSLTIVERHPDPCRQLHTLMITYEKALTFADKDPDEVRGYKVLEKLWLACEMLLRGEPVCIHPP